jgi:hypothetical protein
MGTVVALEDFQITAFALPRSPTEDVPEASNVIDLASLHVVFWPGFKAPA